MSPSIKSNEVKIGVNLTFADDFDQCAMMGKLAQMANQTGEHSVFNTGPASTQGSSAPPEHAGAEDGWEGLAELQRERQVPHTSSGGQAEQSSGYVQ